MTCMPFKMLCFKDTNKLTFPYMSWQPVPGLSRGKLKTISILRCEPGTRHNLVLSECHVTLPLTS